MSWPRYECNGRFKVLCAECGVEEVERRVQLVQAHALGYASLANTPEYKRRQREAQAQREGGVCLTAAQRATRKARNEVERKAARLRAEWARNWLKPFDVPLTKEEKASDVKRFYHRNIEAERERQRRYKHSHPERRDEWNGKRAALLQQHADGSVTDSVLRALFSKAKECPYCGDNFKSSRKSLDHLNPVSEHGLHSTRNVVVCCWKCNQKKRALNFTEWLARVEEDRRPAVRKLYEQITKAVPEQRGLGLVFVG